MYFFFDLYISKSCYDSIPLTLVLIRRGGVLSICVVVAGLLAEGAKNVSWPWLSPFQRCGSLTMAFTAKFVYIYIYIYIYIYR